MKCPLCNGTGTAIQIAEAKPTTEIGRILREAREDAGYSLRMAERATGVSNALISQVETGHIKKPSFDTVIKLCDVYGIKPSKLTKPKGGETK
jgi:HTH-type transcriptional regulator, competence development regulator